MKIAVAGAGIMGQLIAFELVNAGHSVSLFDKDDASGNKSCSMTAAGMLAPISELEKSDLLIYHMGIDAINQHWPTLLHKLGKDIYFEKSGTIVLAHPRDRSDLTRFIKMIDAKLNYTHQLLTREQLINLEPGLEKFDDTYYFPAEAHLDNQSLLAILREYLYKNGVEWHTNTFIDEIHPGKISINNTIKKFDVVLDCRGMGAKSVFSDLHGIRGELIWLRAQDLNIKRPIRFLHPRYSIYITPRSENIYIIGASEIHSEDYSEISVQTILELLTAAYYLHPGFAEARILKTVTQCRPTLSNYLPKIKFDDGFIAVNGLYRHGFLIAPSLAADIANFIDRGSTSLRYPQLWEKYHDSHSI